MAEKEECFLAFRNVCKKGPLSRCCRERIKSMLTASRVYEDGKEGELQRLIDRRDDPCVFAHRACVSTYCSTKTKAAATRKKRESKVYENPNPKKRLRQSDGSNFNFREHCLYCGTECKVEKDPKNPGRWVPAYQFREIEKRGSSKTIKKSVLDICDQRNDEQANLVRIRVNGAPADLHAADARYHASCRSAFSSPKSIKAASSSASNERDSVVKTVTSLMSEDRSLIWNSNDVYNMYIAKGGNDLCKKSVVSKVIEYFGNEVVVLSSPGVASIIVFRDQASATLRIVNDDSGEDVSFSVQRVAKAIQKEISHIEVDKGCYKPKLNQETATKATSPTLLDFLCELSPKLDSTTLPALMIGNIVTSSLRSCTTPLQLALSVMIRESKELLNCFHSFGVTCSYDEFRRFRKSVAVAASYNASLHGVSDAHDGLIQFMMDNFDHEVSSANGKKSTHSLAVIMTQPRLNKSSEQEEATIRRLSKQEASRPIEYDHEVIRYHGPKKPHMPAVVTIPEFTTDKDSMIELDILERRAKEMDLSFFKDIHKRPDCPEYNGYNAEMIRGSGQSLKPKTCVSYMPLIDMPPAHHDTIMTAMTKAQTLSLEAKQKFTVMTADLQLYKIMIDVLWVYPDKFPEFYPRLGGMHLFMSFVGCCGTLMAGSGLSEILSVAFGGVQKMLSGKKFPQNVRALRMVAEEILREFVNDMNSPEDLTNRLETAASKSHTTKLWVDCFLKPVFIMMIYMRAEKEGEFQLHLRAVEMMLPFFFAAGHIHYARYATYYLTSMKALPQHVLYHFTKGDHVVRHTDGIWNGIWSDMFIETTFMRYGKGKHGIIGITLNPEALKSWALSLHVCGQIAADVAEMRDDENVTRQASIHKEESKSRIQADAKDRQHIRVKMMQCISPLDDQQHPEGSVVNIVTGRIHSASLVNVHNSFEIGSKQYLEFTEVLPQGFHHKIERRVTTMADTKKSIKIGTQDVFDTNIIFSRVVCLQASNRDIDIDHLMSHELAPLPTALFADSGDMRISTSKSVLKNDLKIEVSSRLAHEKIEVAVIDGCALLWIPSWPAVGTVQTFLDAFKHKIAEKLSKCDVYLVFDRYNEFSIKHSTRLSRSAGRVYQLTPSTPIPNQKAVLTVTSNKKQLIKLISEDLQCDKNFIKSHTQKHTLLITGQEETIEINKGTVIKRRDLYTSHEEADNIIVQQAFMAASKGASGVAVVADDTDVFVLLLHHYLEQKLDTPILMESLIYGRSVIDIKATAAQHADLIPNLLAGHCLSGCDTVAGCFGIGKKKMLNTIKEHPLNFLGKIEAPWPEVVKQATQFAVATYGQNTCSTLCEARIKIWKTKIGKGSCAAPKLCSLPPTDAAFQENLKRAHLQTFIWKNALKFEPQNIDPSEYGWRKDGDILCPTTVSAEIQLVPEYIQKIISCCCSSDSPCESFRCGCNKAGMTCSVFCSCQQKDTVTICHNRMNTMSSDSDDEMSDEEIDRDNWNNTDE